MRAVREIIFYHSHRLQKATPGRWKYEKSRPEQIAKDSSIMVLSKPFFLLKECYQSSGYYTNGKHSYENCRHNSDTIRGGFLSVTHFIFPLYEFLFAL